MSEVIDNPQSDVLNMALDKIETLTAELAELANSTTSDHIAAKYWKQRQDARNETGRVTEERDAVLAVIAEVKAWEAEVPFEPRGDDWQVLEDALLKSPVATLAKVKADALREAADSRNGEVKEWLNWRAEQIENVGKP